MIFFALIVMYINAIAQASIGLIKGSIQNPKQEPLAGISIKIEGTKQGTVTDEDGVFNILNVAPGNYTLVITGIGYTLSKTNVIVKPGEATNIDLQLNEATKELEPATVKTLQQKNYVKNVSESGTRLPLKLIETPQTIQVITSQVLKDQQAQNLNDVTKNMTGVINNNMYTSYTMRGFTNYYPNSFITFDGFTGNMYQWSQMVQLYNIDRVEMIAGPASALYSTGQPGGVINMVTKRPLDEKRYSFNVTTGSWGLIDAEADLTGPLTKNKKLLYRLNIGYNNANSFRPRQFNQNIVIAPSLTYNISNRTNINLDFVNAYNNGRFAYDRGGLVFMNADSTYNFKGALSTFVHNSPKDYSTINAASITLRVNHRFSDNVKLSFMSRVIRTRFDMGEHFGIYYGDHYFTHLDSLPRQYDSWQYKPYNIQNSVFATISTGGKNIQQTIVAGMDYQVYGASQNRYISGDAPTISITHPDYSRDDFSTYQITANTFVEDDKQRTRQFGAYVQDLISLGHHFKLLLAGRFDNYFYVSSPASAQNYTQANDSSTAHVFLPRVGLVYTIGSNSSVYGSYCESFNPQNSNNRGAGGPFPPQKGKQYEVGYKALFLGNKLLTTIALYNIDFVNILATDPADVTGKRQIAIPGLTSSGAEFTVQGHTGAVNVIAGYAYNNVVFADNSPLGKKGGRYDNAPQHIANLWLQYAVPARFALKGFRFSAGGKYIGNRVGSGLNQHFLMPGYLVLDAAASYNYKNIGIALNAFNLLNTKYVLGYYSSDLQVPIGTPANFKVSISYTIK